MKTIILWLMVTPGNWQTYIDVYATAAECHIAEHILQNAYPTYRWYRFKEIYAEGGGLGMFWVGCY